MKIFKSAVDLRDDIKDCLNFHPKFHNKEIIIGIKNGVDYDLILFLTRENGNLENVMEYLKKYYRTCFYDIPQCKTKWFVDLRFLPVEKQKVKIREEKIKKILYE